MVDFIVETMTFLIILTERRFLEHLWLKYWHIRRERFALIDHRNEGILHEKQIFLYNVFLNNFRKEELCMIFVSGWACFKYKLFSALYILSHQKIKTSFSGVEGCLSSDTVKKEADGTKIATKLLVCCELIVREKIQWLLMLIPLYLRD